MAGLLYLNLDPLQNMAVLFRKMWKEQDKNTF